MHSRSLYFSEIAYPKPCTKPASEMILHRKRFFQTTKKIRIYILISAPQVGLEPTTTRLTAGCSAIELLRNIRIRQRPTLPGRVQPSTIGTERLNFCVRYGNRCDPLVITTGNCELVYFLHPDNCTMNDSPTDRSFSIDLFFFGCFSQPGPALNQALDRLVSTTYTPHDASSVDLSTW